MLTLAEIRKLPPIDGWKNDKRQAGYYKGSEKLSFTIYMIYKNSNRPLEMGPQEDIFCITFIEMNGEFLLCLKKGGSRATMTGIGKNREKAIQNIIRTILGETHANTFCPEEKLEELTAALKKSLESA